MAMKERFAVVAGVVVADSGFGGGGGGGGEWSS